MLSFLWATFETAMRGFLLGFGAMICKEVLTGKEVLTFSKARVASACGGLFYFMLYLPFQFINSSNGGQSKLWLRLLCLMCPTALGIGR